MPEALLASASHGASSPFSSSQLSPVDGCCLAPPAPESLEAEGWVILSPLQPESETVIIY